MRRDLLKRVGPRVSCALNSHPGKRSLHAMVLPMAPLVLDYSRGAMLAARGAQRNYRLPMDQ
jgi:hypothetical protein